MRTLDDELDYIRDRVKWYYGKALQSKYVEKPLAWAVYQVWRHYDAKEEKRSRDER